MNNLNSQLEITKHGEILVVDSRLIALELGIKHKNFLATLDKYLGEVEADWGQVAFETETVKNSVGASNTAKYALLTEPQATLLMTYSRNTEHVRNCKRKLVKAFEKAKSAYSNSQEKRIIELEKSVALLQSQIQTLFPIPTDFTPPGWSAETWASLPPQDKKYFQQQYRDKGFTAGNKAEIKALPVADRAVQRKEIEHLINDVPEEHKQFIEKSKKFSIQRFLKFWVD